MAYFFIWSPQKKHRYLQRYPENNLFTLKKTNTYRKLKRSLCEKIPFLFVTI